MNNKRNRILRATGILVLGALGLAALASCGGADTKTITFDTDHGTPISPKNVEWGTEFKATDIPETTKEGYSFDNWFLDQAKQNVFTSRIVEEDFTLYAGWNINSYIVNYFDANGVTKLFDDASVNYRAHPALPTPEKENHTFTGWYTTNTYDQGTQVDASYTMPAKDVKFYASWDANHYDISFFVNAEDGQGSMEKVRLNFGESLPKNTFTRLGYAFVGWNTEEDGSGATFADEAVLANIEESGVLNLYAQWAPYSYKVSFYNNASLLSNLELSIPYGSKFAIPEGREEEYVESLDGYDFQGWGLLTPYDGESLELKNNYFISQNNTYGVISLANALERFANGEKLFVVKALENDYVIRGETVLYALYERKQNTITFDVNGGEKIDSITKYYGEAVTLPNATKEGYTFDGWSKEGDTGTDRYTTNMMPATNVNLVANWKVNSYQLSYVTNSNDSIASKATNYGESITLPTGLTKTGYTFAGWYYDENFIKAVNEDDKMPAHDITLYANWSVNQYIISFDTDGGSEVASITQNYGTDVTAPANPTKAGYTFAGWSQAVPATMPAQNIELVAQWAENTITFNFNGNGATSGSTAEQTYKYSEDLGDKLPVNGFTRTGYTFAGWNTKADGSGQAYASDYTLALADFNAVGKEVTLYAQWDVDYVKLTIRVSVENTDALGTYSFDKEYINNDYKTGEQVSAADLSDIIADIIASNYEHYELDTVLSAITMSASGNTLNVNLKLERLDVRFFRTDGSGTQYSNTFTVAYGTEIPSASEIDNFVKKTGYTPSYILDEVEYDSYADIVITEDCNVEVKYEINNYALTANANGGTFTGNKTSLTFNEFTYGTPFVGNVDKPSRTGYEFAGWYFDAECTEPASTMDDAHFDIYAKWNVNQYTISFDTDGGSEVASITQNYGTDVIAPANPTKDGYTFAGWSQAVPATMPANNLKLVAQWAENTLTIKFNGNEQTSGSMNDASYTYTQVGTKIPANAFVRTGYNFAGWNTKADGTGTAYDNEYALLGSDFTNSTNEITLYAQWTINYYTISFDTDGGSEVDAITQEYNSDVIAPANPTKDGYTFAGWSQAVPATMPANNLKLVAQWTTNSVTFRFQGNGHNAGSTGSQTYTYPNGLNQSLPGNGFTRTGYTFVGWNTKADGSGIAYASNYTLVLTDFNAVDKEVTLYAQWQINKYTISFNSNGGSEVDAITQEYNSDVTAPEHPTKEHLKFAGWYFDPELTVAYTFSKMPAEDITLYAKWEEKPLIFMAEGKELYRVPTYNSSATLMDHITQTYEELKTLDFMYTTLNGAINGMTVKEITGLVVLSNLYGQMPDSTGLSAIILYRNVNGDHDKFVGYVMANYSLSSEEAEAAYAQAAAGVQTLQAIGLFIQLNGDVDAFIAALGEQGEAIYAQIKPIFDNLPLGENSAFYTAVGNFCNALVFASSVDVQVVNDTYAALLVAFDTAIKARTANVALIAAYVNVSGDEANFAAGFKSVTGQEINATVASIIFNDLNNHLVALPLAQNIDLYNLLASVAKDASLIYQATEAVSNPRSTKQLEFDYYEQNAYNPPSSLENHYFDSWAEFDGENAVIKNATYTYKLDKVGGYLESHTSSSVTFTWNPILNSANEPDANVWGYRIVITRNGVAGEPFLHEGVTNTTYTVNSLEENEVVKISVVALFKQGNTYIESSKEFAVTSIADGSSIIVAAQPISSELSEFSYTNREAAEIDYSKTAAGEYFYINKEDQKLYLYTSGNYSFSNADYVLEVGSSGLVNIDGKNVRTSSKTGYLQLNLGGTIYDVTIYPLFDRIELGNSYKNYNSTTLTNEITLDQSKGLYLSANSVLDSFKVGKAFVAQGSATSNVYKYSDYQCVDDTTYYYNGIKLDFVAKSDSGATIDNTNFKYDVTVKSGVYTLEAGTDYYYDRNNFVIYFLNSGNYSGECEIAVTPKLSENIYVPRKVLEEWGANGKTATKDPVTFTVEVVDGFNAYSNESLRYAFNDKTLSTINLLCNIKANYTSKMVAPVDFLVGGVGDSLVLKDDVYGNHGEVDIVDGTAYMALDASYIGPKYKMVSANYEGYMFSAYYLSGDNYTIGYFAYDKTGSYRIDHGAEWTQNAVNGHFKIVNAIEVADVRESYASIGLEIANIYSRTGKATQELTVNGNYFTVDASHLPYIYSNNHVTAGTYEADYQIQSVVVSIFNNECYDPDATVGIRPVLEETYVTVNSIYYALPLADYASVYSPLASYVKSPDNTYLTAINNAINAKLTDASTPNFQKSVLAELQGQLPSEAQTQLLSLYVQVGGNEASFVGYVMTNMGADEATATAYYNAAKDGYQQLASIALYAQVNGDKEQYLNALASALGASAVDSNKARVTFKDLTLYGNTSNISKFSTGTEYGIKAEMEEKSGGINGFASRPDTGAYQDDRAHKPAAEDAISGTYANTKASAEVILKSVNVYDTLIGLYSDTYMSVDYVRVDNSWANGLFAYGGYTDSIINISHSYIGSSGGAAVDVEDNSFKYNPTVEIDYSTVVMDNLVTGEEPWFKGYSMEVLALKLKGQFEQLVAGVTANADLQAQLEAAGIDGKVYTILQEVETAAGRQSEEMNFVALGKCSKFQSDEMAYAHVVDFVRDSYPESNFVSVALDDATKTSIGLSLSDDYIFLFDFANEHSYFYCNMYQEGIGVIYVLLEMY